MSGEPALTLRVLGSGAAFSRRYGTTCSVLTLPSGELWLIDCGRQAPEQLADAGLGWHDVTGQLVTHVHGDHVYGLEEFAFVRYYVAGRRTSVMKGGERPRLAAHSAVLSELWEVLGPSLRYRSDANGTPVSGRLEDYFDVLVPTSVEPPQRASWNHAECFELAGDLQLVVRETRHVYGKPSTSFEFQLPGSGGRSAWWSGDSVVDPALLRRLSPRANVLFHDCTFTEFPGQVHGLFSDLEKLPRGLREKIVLMHHEDDIEAYRGRAETLGFRLAMPGDVYDLNSGERVQGSGA